jgi:hypothetical protein
MLDRNRTLRANDGTGELAVTADKSRAEFLQRCHHPAHRAPAQRRIATEKGDEGVGRRNPHQKSRASAGIAEIEYFGRRAQSADPTTLHGPDTVLASVDRRPERAERGSGTQDVVAFQQVGDRRFTDAQGAENQRAVRDRFVARDGHGAMQRRAKRMRLKGRHSDNAFLRR